MSTTSFYQMQAAEQQLAADGAELENVRERCQRASDAWSALARRSQRNDDARGRSAAAAAAASPVGDGD